MRRFSGSNSPRAVASQTAELMRTLREKGFAPIGAPSAWFYDPPWTIPMLRRNEIAITSAIHSRVKGRDGYLDIDRRVRIGATASMGGGRASRPAVQSNWT